METIACDHCFKTSCKKPQETLQLRRPVRGCDISKCPKCGEEINVIPMRITEQASFLSDGTQAAKSLKAEGTTNSLPTFPGSP